MSVHAKITKETRQELIDLIDSHTEKIKTRTEKYKVIAKNDILNEINRTNIDVEMQKNISIHQKWVEYLLKEKQFYTKIGSEYDKIEAMLYNDLRYNSDIRDSLKNQKDYDFQLKLDSIYLKMHMARDNQKTLIEFVTNTCQIIYNKNFTMKNIYEVWKADLGLMGA